MMTKASNKDVTLLRKLKQRKHRQKEQLFIVEGERAVEQIIRNGCVEVGDIFISNDLEHQLSEMVDEVKVLSEELFRELSDTESPQGILAVCNIPEEVKVEDWAAKDGLLVAFDRIQDPGNLGTMLRTAAWFGTTGLLAGKGTVDMFNPKVVRSTAGAAGSLPYATGVLTEMLNQLEGYGWQTLLLDGNPGAEKLQSVQPEQKCILVVGNEAGGIDPELMTPARKRVMIPHGAEKKVIESLNASVALSIGLYHICMQVKN